MMFPWWGHEADRSDAMFCESDRQRMRASVLSLALQAELFSRHKKGHRLAVPEES